MKIKSVSLEPLKFKHYATEILVEVYDEFGFPNDLYISISGYSPKASQREVDKGWEPDYGMDHVESEAGYKVALAIVEALNGKVL